MIVMAAAFGGAWQLFPDRVVADFFEKFGRQLFGYASHLQLGWVTTAAAAIAILLLAVLLLRLLSVALALVQYYGFRLSEEQKRLTVERGLLAKLRTSVARRRIQSWTLQEGFLHRLFGRRSLHIDTAVAELGKSDHRAFKELAPIATPEACDALVRHLLPQAQWPPQEWSPVAANTWWRLFLPAAIVFATLAAGLLVHFREPWGLLPLLWLPWGAYAARQRARREGYALDGYLVSIRGGWWSRYWRFAEIAKLQALRLQRSPIDRSFGTLTLYLDTSGASTLSPTLCLRFVPEAQARAVYQELGERMSRRGGSARP
jgi:putative membrane protein